MAENTTLTIIGEKRLRRKMQLLPKAIRKELSKLFNKTSQAIVKDIRGSILRNSGSWLEGPAGHWSSPPGSPPNSITGELMRSVKSIQTSTMGNIKIVIDAQSFYAAWLEFGTRRMEARPFMRPAFRRHSPKLTKGGRSIIAKVPKRISKS